MMRQRVAIFLVLAIGIGLIVTACGGGGSKSLETVSPTTTSVQPTATQTPETSATPVGTESEALKEVEKFFQNPPDFTVDLSEKTLEDPAVPTADMEIPKTETGSLDMNLNMDSNINASLPAISLPSTSGLLTSPALSLPSLIPTPSPTTTPGATTTPTGLQPDAATCAAFSAVPSCDYVPEQYRQLCEQCKAQQK